MSTEDMVRDVRTKLGKPPYWWGHEFKQQAVFEIAAELYLDGIQAGEAVARAAEFVEQFERDVINWDTKKYFRNKVK